ncbi:hypothetical protein McanMca71_007792 [Microsporum canis]
MPPPSSQRADIEPPPQVSKEATMGFITGAVRVLRRSLDSRPSDPLASTSNALHTVVGEQGGEQPTVSVTEEASAGIQASDLVLDLDCADVEGLPWFDAAV